MKRHIYIILTLFLTACGTTISDKKDSEIKSNETDTSTFLHTTVSRNNDLVEDKTNNDYATYFIVVVDTSSNYYSLHKKMYDIHRRLSIPIDTMGRFYNSSKNLIALADNDEDEIYAGNYFPRRFPSDNLSLEYLSFYQSQAGEKTIALVTGIYEKEKSADSVVTILKRTENKVFKIKSEIYVGCMH